MSSPGDPVPARDDDYTAPARGCPRATHGAPVVSHAQVKP